MSRIVNVDFGVESRARAYLPEDSLKARNLLIQLRDGSYVQEGYGWALWLEPDGTWYHLGGYPKTRKPTIFFLKLKIKRNGTSEWRWSKHTDQSRANELYEKYGKQPVE